MPVDNKYDEKLIKNRFLELANRAYSQNTYTFTDFLGVTSQNIFWRMENELSFIGTTVFGGTDECDRVMVRFGDKDSLGYEENFPIACIKIESVLKKFADEFSHRDFLGAFMNLGVERNLLGDIYILNNVGYLFCHNKIAEYIMDNLDRVKHTCVKCTRVNDFLRFHKDEGNVLEFTVTSDRIDVVIVGAYHISRKECLECFEQGIVYVNGRLCTSNAKCLKVGDVVNVRGRGKFCYEGIIYTTKKDKYHIKIQIYR